MTPVSRRTKRRPPTPFDINQLHLVVALSRPLSIRQPAVSSKSTALARKFSLHSHNLLHPSQNACLSRRRPRVRVPAGLNGLDLQKRIASDRIDMPIIFITGHGDIPMSVQAMKAGAIAFLTKPFGDDVLVECHPKRHRTQPGRAWF